ncbi:hypothetical protein CPT_Slocum_189 [Serratia phage Slocum]|nr:hypothetical protein CPT_Slocum_189 [Serratia phage Slocum]
MDNFTIVKNSFKAQLVVELASRPKEKEEHLTIMTARFIHSVGDIGAIAAYVVLTKWVLGMARLGVENPAQYDEIEETLNFLEDRYEYIN